MWWWIQMNALVVILYCVVEGPHRTLAQDREYE